MAVALLLSAALVPDTALLGHGFSVQGGVSPRSALVANGDLTVPRSASVVASAAATAVDGVKAATPVPNDAFRIVRSRGVVELQTAVYRVTPRLVKDESRLDDGDRDRAAAEIVLVSMVHLADHAYYREIMRDASGYDRVLFEMIAGPEVAGLDPEGRRSVVEYVYPTREQVHHHIM